MSEDKPTHGRPFIAWIRYTLAQQRYLAQTFPCRRSLETICRQSPIASYACRSQSKSITPPFPRLPCLARCPLDILVGSNPHVAVHATRLHGRTL